MSKEMSADEYRDTCYIKNDYQKIMYGIQLNHYKELVAKEAVKEFAEELMNISVFYDSNFKVVTTKKIQKLAKQKGVEI